MTSSIRNFDLNQMKPFEPRKIKTDDLNKLEQHIIKTEGRQAYNLLNQKIEMHKHNLN